MSLVANWKTSVAGLVVLLLGALETFAGVHVPGAMDFYTALPIGVGLILGKDAV